MCPHTLVSWQVTSLGEEQPVSVKVLEGTAEQEYWDRLWAKQEESQRRCRRPCCPPPAAARRPPLGPPGPPAPLSTAGRQPTAPASFCFACRITELFHGAIVSAFFCGRLQGWWWQGMGQGWQGQGQRQGQKQGKRKGKGQAGLIFMIKQRRTFCVLKPQEFYKSQLQ